MAVIYDPILGKLRRYDEGAGPVGPTGATGADGADGEDSYTYIAYAEDNAGTGFNTSPDASRPYIAIINSSTDLSPVDSSDFSGATWTKYLGDDGASEAASAVATHETTYDHTAFLSAITMSNLPVAAKTDAWPVEIGGDYATDAVDLFATVDANGASCIVPGPEDGGAPIAYTITGVTVRSRKAETGTAAQITSLLVGGAEVLASTPQSLPAAVSDTPADLSINTGVTIQAGQRVQFATTVGGNADGGYPVFVFSMERA